MSADIQITDAWLRFRYYRNPSPSLKERMLSGLKRNRSARSVKEFYALKNINLSIKDGDRLGIIGLNGAGKSTLLKMIVGIYPPYSGSVEVRGRVSSLIELGTGFDLELSGRENIYLNGTLLGISFREMKKIEKEIIEFSELNDKIDLPVKYYSSGMYSRLAFSIAASVHPEILIADEVFATGDAQFIGKSLKRMKEMFNSSKIMVLVSHGLEQIVELCNRVIVLHEGEIVAQGEPRNMVDYYLRNIAAVELSETQTEEEKNRTKAVKAPASGQCALQTDTQL